MTVAIIPARGGSKRIPRKNIRCFAGRPMIAHSIMAARQSGCFSRIVVSTDDQEIAEVARHYGAEVPFMRPAALADDFATTVQVMAHAVDMLALDKAELVCCLYATAPLVSPDDIRQIGLCLQQRSEADYAFPVTTFAYPVQRALIKDKQGRVAPLFPEFLSSRSQDLAETYHDAGQFYWGRASAFLQQKPIVAEGAVGVPIPRWRVQDIDTEEDWQQAELLFQALLGKTTE